MAKGCTCDKVAYATKAKAEAARLITPERQFLNVYTCPNDKKVFHVGHRARRLSPLLRLDRAMKRGA